MLNYPKIDPVALQLGPIAIHWYGLTYLVAFGLFLWLASIRVRRPQFASRGWTRRDVEDLLFYGVVGVVLGGRLGYVIFYKASYYASHLGEVFAVWKGGMSFHGGLVGVIVAMAVFVFGLWLFGFAFAVTAFQLPNPFRRKAPAEAEAP